MTLPLFNAEPVSAEPAEQVSADAARTARQRRAIELGYHPLLAAIFGYTRRTKLHPYAAPETCSPDGPKGQPYTCGSCRFREVLRSGSSRSYPKCIYDVILRGCALDVSPRVSHGAGTDVRAWWPACQDYEPGAKLSPDAARWLP